MVLDIEFGWPCGGEKRKHTGVGFVDISDPMATQDAFLLGRKHLTEFIDLCPDIRGSFSISPGVI